MNIFNYRITFLNLEYDKLANYLLNYQKHIFRCYEDNIIDYKKKGEYLKLIHDLVAKINIAYENEENNVENNLFSENFIKLNNIKYQSLYNKLITIEYNKNNNHPFNKIYTSLNELGKNIGFYHIKDGIEIISKNLLEISHDMKIFKKIFIPIKYSVIKDLNIKNSNYHFNKEQNNSILDLINMNIKMDGYNIIFTGYIKNDPLNILIKISKISCNYLYDKITLLENEFENLNIDENFSKNYIKNMNIANILCLPNDDIRDNINDDYKKYLKLKKIKFINMINEYLKKLNSNDKTKATKDVITTLKLLLMDTNKNSIKMAGMLYGILKDAKKDGNINYEKIILDNLSYLNQLKLEKTNIEINKEIYDNKNIYDCIDNIDYKKIILIDKNIPHNVKKYTIDKVNELKKLNNDYNKQLLYINTVLKFPWNQEDNIFENLHNNSKDSMIFINNLKSNLDKYVYGQEDCKECIIENIAKWISNPNSNGNALGLVGPPGTGKTLIAKSLGESLNIPLVQVTLGGQNDGDYLYGHNYTYVSAQPGIIIRKMIESGSSRCIMYFDELDKTCIKNNNDEIQNILIHLIDPNTNKHFQDRFFQEFTFPLNNVLFIFSYNNSNIINKILLDRITEINMKSYTKLDKINISKKYIISEMEKSLNLYNYISFTDKAIEKIIDNYTNNEEGIRELKRKFEKIYLKVNVEKIFNPDIKNVEIRESLLEKYLGKPLDKSYSMVYS